MSISNKRSGSDFLDYFPPCWWWRVQCYAFLKRPQSRHHWAYLWALASSEARARPNRRFKFPDVSWTGCTDSFSRHTRHFLWCLVGIAWFCLSPSFACSPIKREVFSFVKALYVICAQCLIFLLNVFSVYTFFVVVVVAMNPFLWMYFVQDPFEILARLYHQFYPLYTTIWLYLFQIKWAWSVRPTFSFPLLSLSTRQLLLWHTVVFFWYVNGLERSARENV